MTDTTGSYDIFISYRHSIESDLNTVREMASDLRQAGLAVFMDETGVNHFDSITQTIQRDLANSKALLVYLSGDYLASRACLWELTAAFIAAQKKGGDPRDRIFVINPGDTTESLNKLPVELRDAKYALSLESVLPDLPERLQRIEGTFQDLGSLTFPRTFGRTLTGSPRFVGRLKELWNLHSDLNASGCTMVTGHTGPDIAQVSGMGGIGKSLLAEEYALRFGAAYPGGVFWLEAHGSFNPEAPDVEAFKAACSDQFLKILYACGKTPLPDTPFEYLKAQIAGIIEAKGDRCLWIVDDIPHGLADHLNTVKDWFAPHPSACTLVTTQSRQYVSVGKELPLDILDEISALELLEKHGINLEKEKKDATTLIERLGGHALALDIAGATIAELNLTIAQYLADREADMEELLDVPEEYVGTLPTGHERSIIKTLQHSISQLGDESLDFLKLAANLSPAPIRTEFIEEIFTAVDGLETIESRKRARKGVLGCEQLSLAKRMDTSWQVHALISATLKYMGLDDDERGASLRAAAMTVLTALIKPDLMHEQAERIALDVEHARFLTATIQSPEELKLLYHLAHFDHFHGHVRLSVMNWQRLLAFNKKILGSEHPDTLKVMGSLALTLGAMGDSSGARKLQKQVLHHFTEILGPEHPDTLRAVNDLASTQWIMGDPSGARKLQEQVLDRSTEILGPKHPNTLAAMSNLASTLWTMGDPSGARKLQEQVLDRSTEILGPKHPNTLIAMGNLAQTLEAMGDLSCARKLEEQVLDRSTENLGPKHPNTLRAMNNLAQAQKAMGDLSGARKLQEQVLRHFTEILGPEHPNTLAAMGNLAQTLKAVGDLSGARKLEEQVLDRRTEILGLKHPDTTLSAWNLLTTFYHLEEIEAIREILSKHLMWLTEADEATLDSRQQQIREQVQRLTDNSSDQ